MVEKTSLTFERDDLFSGGELMLVSVKIKFPWDPITLLEDDWGVQSPPKSQEFRFHETILSFGEPGSLGI